MKKKIIIIIVSFLLMTFCLNPIIAQNNQTQQTGGTPLIYQLSAKPGETVSQTASISNTKVDLMQVKASVLDFEVADEEQNIKFTNTVNNNHSLASWVTIPEPSFELKKGENKQVSSQINVPSDAKVGAHWAILDFQGFTNNSGKQEKVDETASLILLTVEGTTTESLEIKSFMANRRDDKKTFVFALRASNTGNNFVKPKGTITITNFWGKKIADVPLTKSVIFPNSIFKIATEWKPDKAPIFGRYKVDLNGTYGPHNTEFNTETILWVFPWQARWPNYLLLALLLLFLLYILLFRILKLEIRVDEKTKEKIISKFKPKKKK